MSLIIHFILGFITSFLGTLTPSMLNMTTAKISLNKSKTEAIKFAVGASIVVLAQAYVAILFTKFLRNNPTFVQSLQKMAMVIFAVLAVYFYQQSKKDKSQSSSTKKERTGNSFAVGLLLSALNMFSIPFYCGVTTALDVAGWLKFTQQNILFFVIGSAIGTFALLSMYANYAKIIQLKSAGLAKNLNMILSILTGGLALVTLIKII